MSNKLTKKQRLLVQKEEKMRRKKQKEEIINKYYDMCCKQVDIKGQEMIDEFSKVLIQYEEATLKVYEIEEQVVLELSKQTKPNFQESLDICNRYLNGVIKEVKDLMDCQNNILGEDLDIEEFVNENIANVIVDNLCVLSEECFELERKKVQGISNIVSLIRGKVVRKACDISFSLYNCFYEINIYKDNLLSSIDSIRDTMIDTLTNINFSEYDLTKEQELKIISDIMLDKSNDDDIYGLVRELLEEMLNEKNDIKDNNNADDNNSKYRYNNRLRCTFSQMNDFLKYKGFEKIRQKSTTHAIWKHPQTGVSIPIPNKNGTIPQGTMSKILKQINSQRSELAEFIFQM